MNALEVAGRHGAYTTQFWRPRAHTYVSREAAARARSQKAINRRLVLPLDAHHWIRALEVLDARYARAGRTAEHYQTVIRDMVQQCTPGRRVEIASALHPLRDRAYAEEIPVTRSLWVTLVWAYCTLDEPASALEAFTQAQHRFPYAPATTQHMAELLLPVLCRHGMYTEAEELAKQYLGLEEDTTVVSSTAKDKTSSFSPPPPPSPSLESPVDKAPGLPPRRSSLDRQTIQRCLAEAAALQGEWASALRVLQQATPAAIPHDAAGVRHTQTPHFPPIMRPQCTVNSLFLSTPEERVEASTNETKRPSSPASPHLSREATRQLMLSLVASRHSEEALRYWTVLYGDAWSAMAHQQTNNSVRAEVSADDSHGSVIPSERNGTPSARLPPESDLLSLMNCLGEEGRWADLIHVFSLAYLGRPGKNFTMEETRADSTHTSSLSVATGQSSLPRIPSPVLPTLGATALNMAFAAFPTYTVHIAPGEPLPPPPAPPLAQDCSAADKRANRKAGTGAVPAGDALHLQLAHCPTAVVRLLDALLLDRDDMQLTDYVMAAAGPALLQLQQHRRALLLLQHTPALSIGTKKPVALSEAYRAVRNGLVHAVYYLFSKATDASCDAGDGVSRQAVLEAFPHLFPPEVFRHLQSRGASVGGSGPERGAATERGAVATKTSASPRLPPALSNDPDSSITDEEIVSRVQAQRVASSVRPSRHHYFPTRSSATLTEAQEAAQRANWAAIYAHRRAAFHGSLLDAEKDPRPIPKGLHDHAAGWAYYGRAGEMVFSNSRRTPNMLSMWPKVMRSMKDPYRGWSPRLNSSLAHAENVQKWNGKSSV